MRTNNKVVRDAIKKYVLSCIDTSDYNEHTGELIDSLNIIKSEIERCAFYPNNLRKLKTYQACFIDWLHGLPGCLNIEFRNYEILELMKSFSLPLPANNDETDSINLFYYLVYREFSAICKANKVNLIN